MPTLEYSKSPNVDTAFSVRDGGEKNRVVLTAPQDTSTLEYPENPNSTKGYVTVDGKKHRVVLVADVNGGGSGVNAIPQYTTMPTASASNVGEIAQYSGATDATYTNGYFYKCVSDGENPATYSWKQTDVQPSKSAGIEWAVSIDKPANYSDNYGYLSPVWNFGDLPDGNYEYYFQTLRGRSEIDSTLHIGTDSFVTFKVRFCIQTDSETNKHIQGYMAYVIDGDYDPRGDNNYMLKDNVYHAGWLYNNDLIISNNDAPFASAMYAYEYAPEIKGMFKISKIKNINTGEEITPTGHLYDYQNNESDNWQYINDSYFYIYNLVNVPVITEHYQSSGMGVSPSIKGYYLSNIIPMGNENYNADMAEFDLTITGLNNGMPTGDTWHAIIENGFKNDYKARIIKSTGDLVGAVDLIVGSWDDTYTYIVPHLPVGTNITGLNFSFGFKGAKGGVPQGESLLQAYWSEISGTKVIFDTVGAEITPKNLGIIAQYNEEIPNVAYTKGYFYQATGTVVTVPDSATCTEQTETGTTITVNASALVTAIANQTGWETDYIKRLLNSSDVWDYYPNNNELYWGAYGYMDADVLACFSFSPTPVSDIAWDMTFTPEHQEVQNPAWEEVSVQKSPTTPSTMPTLTVANWSSNTQTVNVTGVTASNIVIVSPAPASAADYAAAGILCVSQATDSLTFQCDTVPTNAITVNVCILN